ncbi:hypothetical protein [Streptomyces sp. SD15]
MRQTGLLKPEDQVARIPERLLRPCNIAKFRRLGYSEEEIAGGSDRIVHDLAIRTR